uniref:VWFA domain-containing protein n=1 Tax=Chelonoidis abingdonii TaxID=106734 RepID=A0A8C0GHP3_CHEAB
MEAAGLSGHLGSVPSSGRGVGIQRRAWNQSRSQEGLAPLPPPVAPSQWGKLTCGCLISAVLAPSHGFSIDVEGPITFQEAVRGFGQSVVQLLVGAPLQTGDVNETGKVYKCNPASRHCQEIPIQSRSTLYSGVQWVCGPTVHRACGENMYVNGYCFLLDQSLRQLQCIPDTLAECPRRATDIALLIDGSSSIRPENFRKMKTFLSEIMKRFRSTDTQFALMQYSHRFIEHFDFSQYRRSRYPDDLVRSVVQLMGWTHTASAIRKVVRELFTSGRGIRDEATKVLIVITEGEKTGDTLSYSDAVPEAERAGIVRYAIGVGDAFSRDTAQQELHEVASKPSDEHVFQVDNFDALLGIQSQLQEKIFAIEGTQSQNSSSFQLEMSQEGFSSLLSPDGPVLGAVGAYDWSGGIYLYGSSGKPSFINVSRISTDMNDAYLGYSSQVVTANGQSSYVVGAPRYQHAGKVILFSRDSKGVTSLSLQVGSYFGGTLCAVDLNRDGNTDLVLIGAPMYYTPLNGGRVYICSPGRVCWPQCSTRATLQGQIGQAFGRFGASMSEIGDISGDGQTDVAIGAPMENDNHGALYIFHGERRAALSPPLTALSAPQRIEGSLFPSRLHYFGQAVSGGTDLTGDGLPDIAVGAQGQVLLLRSRPVLRVRVSISFQPSIIPTSAFDCQGQEQLNTEASRAEVCFTVTKSTKDSLGNRIFSTIQYSLALDPGRTKIRAAFDSTSPVLRVRRVFLSSQLCPEDTLTPITLRLNYTLTGEPITAASNLKPILSEDSTVMTAGLVRLPGPHSGVCDSIKDGCSGCGLSTLVVGVTPELNTTVSIQNRGENSYSTTVRFFYPAALSYRRVLLFQVPSIPPSTGTGHGYFMQGSAVWHSDIWSKAGVRFFAVQTNIVQDSGLWCILSAKLIGSFSSHLSPLPSLPPSDNGGPITERMIHRAELAETGEGRAPPAETPAPCSTAVCFFQVKNLRQRSVPISVTFQFPVELSGVRVWDASEVVPSKVPASPCPSPAQPLPHPAISFHPQDCSVATCKKIRCRIASLEMQQPLEFMIKGNLPLPPGTMREISPSEQPLTPLPQVQTVVERSEVYNYLPVIMGSSVGGLVLLALVTAALYKLNFFKRHYKEMLEDTRDGVGARLGQSDCANVCLSPDIPKQ